MGRFVSVTVVLGLVRRLVPTITVLLSITVLGLVGQNRAAQLAQYDTRKHSARAWRQNSAKAVGLLRDCKPESRFQ